MLQKTTNGLKKYDEIFIDFSTKIDAKLSQKSRETSEATKIDKKHVPESNFSHQGAIFGHFGVPAGVQKSLPWRLGRRKKA